ncbi:hypothetical protein CY34DRAFT_110120 [Suillus luteus UH-Slu-Lm8-n1]|uniref:Uncharacterized protein n=1 Tax=Suillus luteus UH-Slu-Lm8-n1 TaxID=930992 RepID=A0A0C9ZBE4_9AGAM|nr:hypothetical protein CY34DRAFT_110120 [Suillus luteus UH-Slu-Lm8-n1]
MIDYAADEPSWVKDMITHIQFDQASEFSTSGAGDDVSVYWVPRSTNPYYSDTQADSDAPSQPSTVQALYSDSDVKLAARVQLPNCQRSCSDGISENDRSTAIRTVTKIKVGCETQTSATRQTCKRKADSPDGVDAGHDADRENKIPSHTPAIKRICRESIVTSLKDLAFKLIARLGCDRRRKSYRTGQRESSHSTTTIAGYDPTRLIWHFSSLFTRNGQGAIDKGILLVSWCARQQLAEGRSIRSCRIKREEVMELRVVVQCFWRTVRIGRVPQIPQMIVWQAACIDFARVSAAALGPDPSPDGTGALFQRLSPQCRNLKDRRRMCWADSAADWIKDFINQDMESYTSSEAGKYKLAEADRSLA